MNDALSSHRMRHGSALPEMRRPCATQFDSIALLLQGGGALGAYQAGVYQRMLEREIEPTWLGGISIGAINCAIIAGNRREDRVRQLRRFWNMVSEESDCGTGNCWTGLLFGDAERAWANQLAAATTAVKGVPGFFSPRLPPPYIPYANPKSTSYYDTSALRKTLDELVDFDLINKGDMRLSVGAVNVRTANFAYFDTLAETIHVDHIMASAALAPAFEAVTIDGEAYWDGGLVSNTPLDWILSAHSGLDTLVFQVDLWSAAGEMPRDLASVAVRIKEIQYSSRTRAATDKVRRREELAHAIKALLAALPSDLANTPHARSLERAADTALYNIVQLVYRSRNFEGQSKDFEFTRRSMEEHWKAGYDDAQVTLGRPEIMVLPRADRSPAIFDFLTQRNKDMAAATAPLDGFDPGR